MGQITFSNIFTKVIFENVLSASTKEKIKQMLFQSVVALPPLHSERKMILQLKKQKITIFYQVIEEQSVQILAYQFGGTDKLTGVSKAHFKTLNAIFQMTDEEKEGKF